MNRVIWLLRRRGAQLALWAGIALIGGSLAFNWLGVKPLEERVAALESARSLKREGQHGRLEDELSRPGSPGVQLANFYEYFSRDDSLTDLLAKLHAVAAASELEMKRAEYRMSSLRDRKLDRYQVIVPIRGSYRTIRIFVAGALRELPTMSLDQVQFQRKEIGDDVVDAQISFTFHLSK